MSKKLVAILFVVLVSLGAWVVYSLRKKNTPKEPGDDFEVVE